MALYDPKEFPVEAPAINEVAAKLAEARKLIERGWCQRALTRDGSFCALGAICKVVTGDAKVFEPVVCDFTRPLKQAVGTLAIAEWNNAPERTQADVVGAFRKAEAIARAAQ